MMNSNKNNKHNFKNKLKKIKNVLNFHNFKKILKMVIKNFEKFLSIGVSIAVIFTLFTYYDSNEISEKANTLSEESIENSYLEQLPIFNVIKNKIVNSNSDSTINETRLSVHYFLNIYILSYEKMLKKVEDLTPSYDDNDFKYPFLIDNYTYETYLYDPIKTSFKLEDEHTINNDFFVSLQNRLYLMALDLHNDMTKPAFQSKQVILTFDIGVYYKIEYKDIYKKYHTEYYTIEDGILKELDISDYNIYPSDNLNQLFIDIDIAYSKFLNN